MPEATRDCGNAPIDFVSMCDARSGEPGTAGAWARPGARRTTHVRGSAHARVVAFLRRHRAALALAVVAAWAGSAPAAAAEAGLVRPAFRPHRFDEDWRDYCHATAERAPLDRPKCIRLGDDALLTLGSDLRLRVEAVDQPEFGFEQGRDQAALFRAMTHVDLRAGRAVRVFAQLGSFFEAGREDARKPTDVDRLDLIQGFVDLDFELGDGRLTLRGGRQELSLGASRLVGVREGANVRRAFAGGRAFFAAGGLRVDAFFARPVVLRPDAFDDGTSHDEALFGLYATRPVSGPLAADLYYLGYQQDEAQFAAIAGRERRHSFGLRLFGASRGIDWDVEAVGQIGEVETRDIRAWTVASDFGYTVEAWPGQPRLGLKADVASGDRHGGDGTVGTFNALYPRFPYFSEAILVVPANIIDVQLSLRWQPVLPVTLQLGWNPVWRHDTSDAIYAAPLRPIANTAGRPGRFTAHQTIASFDWSLTRHLGLTAQYVHAVPGHALRATGGNTVDFGTVSIGFKY